jgi:HSP20 family molecular chaperone IbpA
MDWLTGSLSRGISRETKAGVFPLMNVTEDKDNFYVRAELPGLKPDELDISVTGDTLSLSGERRFKLKMKVPSITGERGKRENSTGLSPYHPRWLRTR